MQIFRVGNVTLDDGKLSSKNFVRLPQLTVAFEIFTLQRWCDSERFLMLGSKSTSSAAHLRPTKCIALKVV